MGYNYLIGMHIVNNIDAVKAKALYEEFSSIKSNNPTSILSENNSFIKDKITGIKVIVDKIRIFCMPEMVIRDIGVGEFEADKCLNLSGFKPFVIVPSYCVAPAHIKEGEKLFGGSIPDSVSRVILEHRRVNRGLPKDYKYAYVSLSGSTSNYYTSNTDPASLIPLYFKNELIYECTDMGGNIMALVDCSFSDIKRSVTYVNIKNGKYTVLREGKVVDSNSDSDMHSYLYSNGIYGFYRLMFRNAYVSGLGLDIIDAIKVYKSYNLDGTYLCKIDYDNAPISVDLHIGELTPSTVVIPPSAQVINISYGLHSLNYNINIMVPPNFLDLRFDGYMKKYMTDNVKILFYRHSSLSDIATALGVKPGLLNSITLNRILKVWSNIGFYG